MSLSRRVLALTAAAALAGLLLAGCGGGGGGGQPATNAATVALTGKVSFDLVPPGAQGALNYAATSAKPVRGAVVEILDVQDAVVASTSTDEQGNYAVLVPHNQELSVRVRAQMLRSGSGASWDVSVRDNTQGNAIYAMESPSFATGTGAMSRDLHAPSGWGGSGYVAQRVAGPFAVLDTVRQAMAKVQSVAPDTAFPSLRLFWSTENAPTSGSVAAGQIGTTSFSTDSSGALIYLLGKENVDTDEYDSSVIAHEWGHYYQNAFSRDDSPGGSHGFNERLDIRLAFSEGWGNAWSGMALNRSRYTDSADAGQGVGTDIDLSAGAAMVPGWYKEDSVQSILWRLNSQFGFDGIHRAMTGPLRSTPAVTSIHAFAAAYASVLPSAESQLRSLLTGQSISGVTNDPWGAQESNNGGLPQVLPLYKSANAPACVSNQLGQYNKLGSFVYLRFAVQAAGQYRIAVSGPDNADPDFTVYAGARLASGTGPGPNELATVSLPRGDVVVALNDGNDSSANTCFTVTVTNN